MENKMNKKFKPMLLSNDEYDLSKLDYNTDWYISTKLDGVRAEITNEGIKNRSLKTLRNSKMQEYFKDIINNIPEDVILEGEIYSETNPCRKIAGICNSLDKEVPSDTKLYLFSYYDKELSFYERMEVLSRIYHNHLSSLSKVYIIAQSRIKNYEEVMKAYNDFIKNGFEGAVLMNGSSKYKEGRVTVKEQIGYKIKPHKEEDLEIIGVTERFENLNESQKNELGHSFKRNTVDAKKPTGIAAAFICKYKDTTTKVTITGTEDERREIWNNKEEYIGQYAVVKSMDYGAKDKLRHPRLLSIKEKVEK